ncbi:spermidine/putrescine ABC transporter substrate-binding protein [Pseudomonas sp. A46]|nr:extracellular solute-binding protein [Pseudomonas sp. A46]OWJ89149.1 spermidine/putrescine ABC transporter substrate-binding protein [Pseudomonas sp. A46]
MKFRFLAVSAVAAALCASTGFAKDMTNNMTLVSWGGAYQASQNMAFVKPYMELHPEVAVVWDESSAEAVAKLRAMELAGNTTWDLVDVMAIDAIRLCDEGLAMKVDHDELLAPAPNGGKASEDFGELIVSSCFIPHTVGSTTFGYRIDMVPKGVEPPDDICDVWDLETYPGKRALEKRPQNNMEWALLCDGVAKEAVYDVLATPEGQQRALDKLDQIKDQVIWWTAGADTPQLLADGEIFMGSTFNGRLFSAIEEQHQSVAMMWDAQIFDLGGWIIPADLPKDRLARVKDFIRFATESQRQADLASYISYGPARRSSASLIGKHATLGIEMGPHMPTNPDNAKNAFNYSFGFWADHRDEIDSKFQTWLAR